MHYNVRDKYDGYNEQVKNQMTHILNQAKNIQEDDRKYDEMSSSDEGDILSRIEKSVVGGYRSIGDVMS